MTKTEQMYGVVEAWRRCNAGASATASDQPKATPKLTSSLRVYLTTGQYDT